MQDLITGLLNFISAPPIAALFIMSVSLTTTTISQLLTKRFTDMKRLQRYQAEAKQK